MNEKRGIRAIADAPLFVYPIVEVKNMDSVYRDAFPDVFATCDYNPEDLKIDISAMRLEDEPNVDTNEQ